MRIGVLTTGYPTLPTAQRAGSLAGVFVKELCDWLSESGHEVEVVCPQPSEGEFDASHAVSPVRYRLRRRSQRTFFGAGVMENLRRHPNAWPGLLSYPLAASIEVKRASQRWDAAIAHWLLPSGLLLDGVPKHVKRLCVAHSADVRLLERLPMRRALSRRLHRHSLAFVSEALRDRFDACLGTKSSGLICPMGVSPLDELDRAKARREFDVRGPCFLSMGRLVPIKGVDIAIRALAKTKGTLLIAGEGPDRGALNHLAQTLDVDVRFVGVVRGSGKARCFAAADALVMPSRELAGRTEGAPVALLEAATLGLPIIATRSGGIPEIAPPSAQLVPIEDVSALAAAMHSVRPMQPRVAPVDHSWSVVGPKLLAALR